VSGGPKSDAEVGEFARSLGIPGIFDIHVHFMPEPVQEAVWRHFDSLPRPWGIRYRSNEGERLRTLAGLGVTRHTALAYAHKPGMAAWLNDYTLDLGACHSQVVPCFTFYPEPEAEDYVKDALRRDGRLAKIHLQVGKFSPSEPQLDGVWEELARMGIPVVIHAGAVKDGSGGEEWCGMEPVRRLLRQHPDLIVILAHLGAPDYEDAVALAQEFPELLFDSAMVLVEGERFRYPRVLLEFVRSSPHRILFGSDFPSFPHQYAAQVQGVTRHADGPEWLRHVLWENATSLLNRATGERLG